MNRILLTTFFIALTSFMMKLNAQSVGISAGVITPDASSMLEVQSTTKGILIPRVALTATNAAGPITLPATSLLVYNTATASAGATQVTPGYYYNAGTTGAPNWTRLLGGKDGWLTTGNYGTTVASNWLGTNDAVDFATRTNNTERMRILSAGNVLVNITTAPLATAAFTAATSATFTTGVFGIGNGGVPVRGEQQNAANDVFWAHNTAGNGAGAGGSIWATSNQTSTATIIVGLQSNSYFDSTAISAITSSSIKKGIGIIASCDNATGKGIQGQTSGINATGILGICTAVAGLNTGTGVYGSTTQGGSSAAGVYGINSHAAGTGIIAVNSAASSTNYGDAFNGQTSQSNGFGAWGHNNHTSGTGVAGSGNNQTASYLTSGSGGAFTGTLAGSYSKATTAATGTGVIGVGNNVATGSTPVEGSGGAFTGVTYGVYGYATTNSGGWGGYFCNGGSAYTYIGGRNGSTDYKVNGTGSVSTIVQKPDGTNANMFCPESPEILFQDFGSGQLINGVAHIELDSIFSNNIFVSDEHPLRVFIQLEGNCNGVYIDNKSQNGFDVVELNGGESNVEFTWFVVANRADRLDSSGNVVSKHVDVRYPDAPGPVESTELKTYSREVEKLNSADDIRSVPVSSQVKKQ